MQPLPLAHSLALAAAATLLLACGGPTGLTGPADGGRTDSADGGNVPDAGWVFDGHSQRGISDRATLDRYLAPGHGSAKVKFVVTELGNDANRAVWFQDGSFYALHDEWYWFHLLNGVPIPGVDTAPVTGLRFSTVAEIVSWARQQTSLPLDLTWVDGGSRLYSPRFYSLSLSANRVMGLGGIVHFEARDTRPELWLFELEYSDVVAHSHIVRFFQALEAFLPAEIGPQLKWVVRSPAQQSLADQMKAGRLQYWGRVIRYQDVAVPGEVEVYAAGLTAGIPKMIRSGEPLTGTTSDNLLILEDVPDWLPPCAGLVTAVPQTPLAHIALLARNRGTPDAYLGGAMERPDLDQLARGHAPAILQAVAPDQLRIQPMTWTQYNTWRQLRKPGAVVVQEVPTAGAEMVVELAGLSAAQAESLRPLMGGKNAGVAALLRALPDPGTALSAPHVPMGITIRPFVEHLAPLRPSLEGMLNDPAFRGSSKARYLLLEGEAAYDKLYPDADSLAYRRQLVAGRAATDPLVVLLSKGGVKRAIRAAPLAPATLSAITGALQARFGSYASSQALRFRSSSNVEDALGFNAAGLYDSNSGYLHPEAQADPDEAKKSVEWALKKTWASYWSFEAFEERRTAGIPHLAGSMAVLVHAEFDDALEAANGVITLTLRRDGVAPRARMEVNTQPGAESVTNPSTPGALPEVVVVERAETGAAPALARLQPATLSPGGAPVLSDAELLLLFEGASGIAESWLDDANAGAEPAKASRVVVLDFEHKKVKAGWPMMAAGQPAWPARLVLKQVRTLDPDPNPAALGLRLPIPQDVLARARRIERRTCTGPALQASTVAVFTDPNRLPDLGFAAQPFTALVTTIVGAELPELGLAAGRRADLDHTVIASVEYPPGSAAWSLRATLTADGVTTAGYGELELDASGAWRLQKDAAVASGAGLQCTTTVLFSTPEDYLLSLLE